MKILLTEPKTCDIIEILTKGASYYEIQLQIPAINRKVLYRR